MVYSGAWSLFTRILADIATEMYYYIAITQYVCSIWWSLYYFVLQDGKGGSGSSGTTASYCPATNTIIAHHHNNQVWRT